MSNNNMRAWNTWQAKQGAKQDKDWPIIDGRYLIIKGVYIMLDGYSK